MLCESKLKGTLLVCEGLFAIIKTSAHILPEAKPENLMDPILSVHVRLLAVDLLSLNVQSYSPPTFTHKNRPVSRAETLGVVVSRERKDKFLKFLVDDGTGCIPCILWLNHHSFASRFHPIDLELKARMALEYAEKIQLGLLVRVRGRITIFMGVLQITVADVVVERDPNMELLHWLDCIRLSHRYSDANTLSCRNVS